jgi:hypothetical protein
LLDGLCRATRLRHRRLRLDTCPKWHELALVIFFTEIAVGDVD